MQSYSQAFHNAISANTREIRGYIKFNGTFVLDGEGGLISFKTTQTAMEAERFCVGSVCSAMCEATFFNEGLSGSGVSLANSYFDAYIGVVTDPDNNTTEYVCAGRFYVSEISRSTATTRIVGYDIAGRLSMDYAPTVTAGSNGYLAMDILNDIIDQTGVNGGQHFTTYGSTTYVPTLFEGTCRAQWGWLCSLIDGTASNYSGSREESTLGYMKGYVVGNSAANPYAIDDNTTYIDGLSVGDEFTVTSFTSGTTEEPIVVGNGTGVYGLNPYMTQAVATTIEGTVDGYDYYPVTLHWRGDPCLDLMDELSVTSGENTYNVVVMKIETTFNGGLEQTINCWGDSEEYYAMSTSPTQGQINRVSSLVQEIQQAIETADGGVITKILDTDGTWKELVIANNQDLDQATSVWRFNINGLAHSNRYQGGTYTLAMDTQGRIVANVIQTGILQDAAGKNSWNLDTGVLTITDGKIVATHTKVYNHSNYSQSDLTRIQSITSGSIVPTEADFEKYDINEDGVIRNSDLVIVRNMITNAADITKTTTTTIDPSASGQAIKVVVTCTGSYNNSWTSTFAGRVLTVGAINGTSVSATEAVTIGASGTAGTLKIRDASDNLAATLTKDGLTFQNSSSVETAAYPAAGLPMLSAATAVDSNSYRGKVINVGTVNLNDVASSTNHAGVVQEWLKYVCAHYTHATACVFEGVALAGSYRMMRYYIYDTSSVSSGIPATASGQMQNYDGRIWISGTNNYAVYSKLLYDYIAEYGNSDGWYWRKWAGGAVEMWKRLNVRIAVTSSWGNVYYGAVPRQTYPLTLNSSPWEIVSVTGSGGWAWIGCGDNSPSATQSGTYYLFRPSSATATFNIDFYVRGGL